MAEDATDLTDRDPFKFTRRASETDGEFVRFEATIHPSPDRADDETSLPHRRFLLDNPDEHLHPNQEEHVEVLAGEYAVAIDGAEQRLAAGDEITLPEDTPHRHWNPTDEPVRVAHEHRPALQSEALGETLYTLAQAGRTDSKGIPGPLQFAVLMDAYAGHVYATGIPIALQKAVFAVLGPVGRLAGYESRYTRDEIDSLR